MEQKLLDYKCPSCGGALQFDSNSQKLLCAHCDTSFEVDTLKEYDEILKKNASPEAEPSWKPYDENSGNGDWRDGETDNFRSYVCESCGGEIIGDATLAATKCPYCENPVVISKQFSGMLRPDYVLPFKVDAAFAKEAFKKHVKGKVLVPKLFQEQSRIESITGIYVPFWLFDCDTDSLIRYKATRVTCWSDSRYDYTKTDHYLLVRAGQLDFERVPIDGSSKMDDTVMESIEPFDYNALTDFQTAYLAGYIADKYDVDASASVPRINERIKNSTLSAFDKTVVGYEACYPESVNINIAKGDISYVLMPVWILNTKFNGNIYTFAMNGQTGKFVGDLPVDKGKAALWFWSVFAAAAVVAGIISYLCIF